MDSYSYRFGFFVRVFIITFVFLVLILVLWQKHATKFEVVLGNESFQVEVAQSESERSRGLSGNESLEEREGMFFIFEREDKYGFWMKDMKFPIDIIWIDKDFKIIHIEGGVYPETFPKVFDPDVLALYVLEIKAGESDKINLRIGDSVQFNKK